MEKITLDRTDVLRLIIEREGEPDPSNLESHRNFNERYF
jgi:hypothetical protein